VPNDVADWTNVHRIQLWDWFQPHQANPTDVNPSVSQPAIAGVRLIIAHIGVTFLCGTGNSQSAIVGLTESGPPSRVMWGDVIGVPATAGVVDRIERSDLALVGTIGVGLTLTIQGLTMAAGNFAYLNMGGYFA